jgi:PAS domain S-box-containing protein
VRVFKRIWKNAILLGIAALATEAALASYAGSSHHFHLGLLFVFLSAFALGLRATAITAAFLIFPVALMQSSFQWALETYAVVLLSAWVCERWTRVPGFMIVTCAWLLIVGVEAITLSVLGISGLDSHALLGRVLGSSALALIAGTLLLHPEISSLLLSRPRRFSRSSVAMHITGLFACVVFGLAVVLLSSTIAMPLETVTTKMDPTLLIATIFMLFVIIPGMTKKFLPIHETKETAHRAGWQNAPEHPGTHSSGEYIGEQESVTSKGSSWLFNAHPEQLEADKKQAVIVLDGRGRVSYANDHFLELIGADASKVIGRELSELRVSSELRDALLSWQEQTVQFGPGVQEFLCQEGGKQRFFEVSSVLPPRSSGTTPQTSVILSITEITERRTVEAHLLQAQRAKSLSSVVANAAHALNNTLTTIIGHASMHLQREQSRPESSETLSIILENAHAAGRLIWKILDLVEDKGDLKKKVDLHQEMEEYHQALQSFAGADLHIELTTSEDPLWVRCDSSLLMQALTNIVLNCKESYHNREGKIQISLDRESIAREVAHLHPGSRPGNFARIRVQDWGAGMSADVLRRACEPLFSTKNELGQSGLGLSIVYAIVRAHGGFLSVESQSGKGTTISLYFPVLEEHKTTASKSSAKTESTTASVATERAKARILVVEDEPNVRSLISKMVSTLGYEVSSCEDGKHALESCMKNSFDLVLVDMMMPQMGGEEFVRKLAVQRPGVPTIIMTGLVGGLLEQEDAPQILAKPFDLETLSTTIQRGLSEEHRLAHCTSIPDNSVIQ